MDGVWIWITDIWSATGSFRDLLWKEREWLFSGIGATAIAAGFAFIGRRKREPVDDLLRTVNHIASLPKEASHSDPAVVLTQILALAEKMRTGQDTPGPGQQEQSNFASVQSDPRLLIEQFLRSVDKEKDGLDQPSSQQQFPSHFVPTSSAQPHSSNFVLLKPTEAERIQHDKNHRELLEEILKQPQPCMAPLPRPLAAPAAARHGTLAILALLFVGSLLAIRFALYAIGGL
uniref:hypothetical protein n=1 Tax=Ensifer adhaerens TaxID=106592 RepID=UPI003F49997B